MTVFRKMEKRLRGGGKAGRALPVAGACPSNPGIRDQVNHWLVDGLSYPEIIDRPDEDGKDLKPGHLCE